MKKALGRVVKSAIFSTALIGLTASTALAQLTPAQQQAIDSQTGIASPDRDRDRFLDEEFTPRVTPRVEVKKLQIQGAPPGAENIKFELGGIRMDGATAYAERDLRAVYADRIGLTISLADLYVIAAEITRKYRNEGYILTQVVVPPQTIEGGIARLDVVEGTIDNVEVRGPERGSSLNLIRDYAEKIKVDGPLNTKDLERALLLINDVPGVNARGVLNPSPTTAGAADLIIIVDRKRYEGQIGIDNYGTRFLGPVQLSAAASANNFFFKNNERLTVQAVVAPDMDRNELLYGAISYDQPVWSYGTMLTLFGSHTATNPGYTLDQFDVEGWSTNVSAQLMHPFIRSRTVNLSGRVKLDYREVMTRNNIPIDPTRKDHIRAIRIGGKAEMVDNIFGVAFNVLDVEVSQGLDILGANRKEQADKSRPAADENFVKINAELQRLQRVTNDINLLLGVKGQLSANPLLSSEEFGLGGPQYGRGFDPSEVIGEDGVAGKFELQWNEPHEVSVLEDYQLYGFYDVGRIWNDDATSRINKKETLTSTGVGIRANFSELTEAGLLVAVPLNNTPQTMGDRDPRVYMNLNRRF